MRWNNCSSFKNSLFAGRILEMGEILLVILYVLEVIYFSDSFPKVSFCDNNFLVICSIMH